MVLMRTAPENKSKGCLFFVFLSLLCFGLVWLDEPQAC